MLATQALLRSGGRGKWPCVGPASATVGPARLCESLNRKSSSTTVQVLPLAASRRTGAGAGGRLWAGPPGPWRERPGSSRTSSPLPGQFRRHSAPRSRPIKSGLCVVRPPRRPRNRHSCASLRPSASLVPGQFRHRFRCRTGCNRSAAGPGDGGVTARP